MLGTSVGDIIVFMTTSVEPRNPFNLLLMLASVAFVVTALAFAVVPALEEKAKAMGEMPPPSPWRDGLREHGGTILLYQVAAMIVFGLASMTLDRYRRLKMERLAATIPSENKITPAGQTQTQNR